MVPMKGAMSQIAFISLGEMLLEAARAGEHAPGRHDLDPSPRRRLRAARTTFWHSSAPVHTDGLRLASLTAAASSGGSPVASSTGPR